ncbi:hypothetical protein F2Q70_00004064 [Brassica cretica]|uniref:Uncharacterized protein n=1 Tax=Brassica cretica TaxID=69181 RepID=A0A8S9IUH3_BRACR|nr:hypothetical protein F2Q70_00004064 [Brassica cretica]
MVLVADGVRFSGIEWFGGAIRVLGSPCLSVDPFWNWIRVLRGRWNPVSISSNPLSGQCCSLGEALQTCWMSASFFGNMTEREAYVKMVVAHAKAMEANNEFAATLEKRLKDVPRSNELYEIKKVVPELKLGLKMAQNREHANAAQLATAETSNEGGRAWDLPEDFSARDPSAANGAVDVTKCSGGQFEDGEFGIEE